MCSDSRKAQRNSFAHHRANLLFSRLVADKGDAGPWLADVHPGSEPALDLAQLKHRVRAGLGLSPFSAMGAA